MDSSSTGSSAGARGVKPDDVQSDSLDLCAMPSRPIGSASHGPDSAAPREPLGQLERDCEVASARYSAAHAMINEKGLAAFEDMTAQMGVLAAQTREEVRLRERSLDRLKKRIARMTKKLKK